MHILIIEDDLKTGELLIKGIKREGFEVTIARDGESGFRNAVDGDYDALIVDVMIPLLDGLSLVRKLRAMGNMTPALILSARGEVNQKVEGLEAGADDYLSKPYAASELLARLRSLMRRSRPAKPTTIAVADLTFDTASREVRRNGQRIDLSSRESLLLECLLEADGSVVSRRDIIQKVWEYDFDPGTNLVDVYIRRLRDKLHGDNAPNLIHTHRGLGYAIHHRP